MVRAEVISLVGIRIRLVANSIILEEVAGFADYSVEVERVTIGGFVF